jgi:hypothetical protein
MIKHGVFQPQADYTQSIMLSDLRHSDRISLNRVDRTMLLVDASIHQSGLHFPELPHKDLIAPIHLPEVECIYAP